MPGNRSVNSCASHSGYCDLIETTYYDCACVDGHAQRVDFGTVLEDCTGAIDISCGHAEPPEDFSCEDWREGDGPEDPNGWGQCARLPDRDGDVFRCECIWNGEHRLETATGTDCRTILAQTCFE